MDKFRGGYYRICRRLIDSDIGTDLVLNGVWQYLLAKAEWQGDQTGHVLISGPELARHFSKPRFGVTFSISTARRALVYLEETGRLSRSSCKTQAGGKSLVKITQWEKYQTAENLSKLWTEQATEQAPEQAQSTATEQAIRTSYKEPEKLPAQLFPASAKQSQNKLSEQAQVRIPEQASEQATEQARSQNPCGTGLSAPLRIEELREENTNTDPFSPHTNVGAGQAEVSGPKATRRTRGPRQARTPRPVLQFFIQATLPSARATLQDRKTWDKKLACSLGRHVWFTYGEDGFWAFEEWVRDNGYMGKVPLRRGWIDHWFEQKDFQPKLEVVKR